MSPFKLVFRTIEYAQVAARNTADREGISVGVMGTAEKGFRLVPLAAVAEPKRQSQTTVRAVSSSKLAGVR